MACRLAKRVANAFGLARVAPGRIDTILETAKGKPDRDGFFWPKGVDPKGYEEFRTDSTKDRMLGHISPRELGNAMRELARMSGGITRDELRKETATLFGFERLTAGMSSVLDRAVDSALKTGRLQRDGEFLRPGS